MKSYQLTAAARADLREIVAYLRSQATTEIARQFLREFQTTCEELLVRFPETGSSRREFGPGIRCFSLRTNYVIFYRGAAPVQILRVIHGARDLEQLFSDAPPT